MSRENFEGRDAYANGSVYAEEILKQLDERDEVLTSEVFRAQVESERKESSAGSRAESARSDLDALNRAVKETTFLSVEFGNRFGVDFKSNSKDALAWIENRVAELEEELRAASRAEVEARKTAERARTVADLDALNRAVKETTFLSVEFGNRFGVDFQYNQKAGLAWIEKRVAELEQSLRTPSPEPVETQEPTEPEQMSAPVPSPDVEVTAVPSDNVDEQILATSRSVAAEGPRDVEPPLVQEEGELPVPPAPPEELPTPPRPEQQEIPAESPVSPNPEQHRRSRGEVEAEIAYIQGVNASSSYNSEDFQNRYPDFRERFRGGSRDAIAYNWIQNRLHALRTERRALLAEEQAESGIVRPESIGADAGNALREAYRNTERGSASGWLLERAKGTATIGYWEVRQAERFRSNTGAVGEDIEAQSRVLEQTRDLDVDVAHEEAEQIWATVRQQRGEGGITRDDIENASRQIDGEKRMYNAIVADRIVADSLRSVEERLARYRDEYGRSILTPERLTGLEDGIRRRLSESTTGMGRRFPEQVKERVNFVREVRERMDPKYWRRYVYGGVEAALMFFGLKYAVPKLLDLLPTFQVTPGTTAPVSPDQFIQMKDTVWNTSREVLTQHGYSNPTNEQIMKIAKQVVTDNHIGVAEWGIPGNPVDTNMLQGHLLDFRGALSMLAKGVI